MHERVAEVIRNSRYTIAFTGAGISVESGVPPFRGEGGLWGKYDPITLEINYFNANPDSSWVVIREIFYEKFIDAQPNAAHKLLADMEKAGLLKAVITQNIDNLHYLAGNKNVLEFHGNSRQLICLECGQIYSLDEIDLDVIPPRCANCNGLLKPDFVFFGEAIPETVHAQSVQKAQLADLLILIGTTGEVMPAAAITHLAKISGAMIVEINPEKSGYTDTVTDIFIKEKASLAAAKISELLSF